MIGAGHSRCVIVSHRGASAQGGVERVTAYAAAMLGSDCDVSILDSRQARSILPAWMRGIGKGRWREIIDAWMCSFYLSLREGGETFVLSHGFSAFLFPADVVLFHGCIRGYRARVAPDRLPSPKTWVLGCMERLAARRAKKLLCVSVNTRRELALYYGVPEERIRVIWNGVDGSQFPLAWRPKDAAAGFRAIFVGRLEPGKGLDALIEFAQALGRKHESLTLTLVSPDPPAPRTFPQHPGLNFRSGTPPGDMARIYAEADLLFFPSLYEGFEMVTLEALACGLPVVGNAVGAVGELREEGCPGLYLLSEMGADPGSWPDRILEIARRHAPEPERLKVREWILARHGLERWKTRFAEEIG